MNLLALRTEVENRGFDPTQYGSRITSFINDAQFLIARRVDYYINEASYTFSTVTGTNLYPLPAEFARVRELIFTDTPQVVQPTGLRAIDASPASTSRPYAYALDGAGMHLYPTPDNIYPLELRYWTLPPTLVNDTDIPNLPVDWHHLLWVYATWMCYEADDDATMGQYWMNRFNTELSEFAADQKFPSTDYPNRVASMWNPDEESLGAANAWSLWGGYGL